MHLEAGALEASRNYRRIEHAIRYLDENASRQPGLEEVSREIGLSPFHAQRLFTRYAGLSPKRFLGLLTVGHAKTLLQDGRSVLDASAFVADAKAGERAIAALFDRHANGAPRLLLKGTNFQIKVWSALLRVPQGRPISYGELAREIGQPKAAQAVGRALSANPLGFIVPCHRVIRATGALGDYRWGKARRRAILAWEAAGQDAA
jgi:AraC family transcriptional regulator of adaptative response/methylated-DNA-[protein]-cysteine methyltransferase